MSYRLTDRLPQSPAATRAHVRVRILLNACVLFTQRRTQQRPRRAWGVRKRTHPEQPIAATKPRHTALAMPGCVVLGSRPRLTPRAARFTTGKVATIGK